MNTTEISLTLGHSQIPQLKKICKAQPNEWHLYWRNIRDPRIALQVLSVTGYEAKLYTVDSELRLVARYVPDTLTTAQAELTSKGYSFLMSRGDVVETEIVR